MKKNTLFPLVFLLTSFGFSQTYSTGSMALYNSGNVTYTAKVDVTST